MKSGSVKMHCLYVIRNVIPKTVAGIFRGCLDTSPEKRALVDEMGFGALSNLPNYYLKQKVMKELFNRFDIYDNTIHAVAGEVEITTKKIGDALGLSSTGKPFPDKVVPKELSDKITLSSSFSREKHKHSWEG
ncbi:hypothetical protein PIB30_060990 [Stylosanthes scabra]|uniref:Uncharacterized protein n=1 Tax=Stylosanthes scabra TaxID=79078 RepID=A0ABU6XKH5_9FABA|nr:hypothetical protein [Stylosanthes scabra]